MRVMKRVVVVLVLAGALAAVLAVSPSLSAGSRQTQGQKPPASPLELPQEKHLRNIKQLTFGGENAEAYFSFDGKRLTFQSTQGHECDQIYTMNIDGTDRKIANTCCETARYFEKSGGTMARSGHSRTARDIGMADRTPNVRAS